jgi:putative ABC transport system permease protein
MAALPLLLALPILAIIGVTLFDLAFRPSFRRLAFRNIARRRGEAVLVVLGSLLGTAIITSSFLVGDTLEASIRDSARTQLGPVDVVAAAADPTLLPELEAAVADDPIPGTAGALGILRTTATVATPAGADRVAEPGAGVIELDVEAARALGDDPEATGFAGDVATPGEGEVLVNESLAEVLGVAAGDEVALFAYEREVSLEVTAVVPRLGVAGRGEWGGRSANAFVAPGTLAALQADAPEGAPASPPTAELLVAGPGDVFDVDGSDDVVAALQERLAGVDGVDVTPAKADLLDQAEAQGESFTAVFTSVGSFSVIAGILLLVNIFVMLAEERKSELGMLRAVGLKRNHLVRSFGMEGAVYATLAAVAGVVVGIGVARVLVVFTAGIIGSGEFALDLRFAVDPASLVQGLVVGLLIGLVTVWATSLRIGRLNVIRAIRDLPEPTSQRRRLRTLVAAGAGVVVGGAVFASGLGAEAEIPALAGPAISLFCLVPLLSRLLPRRLAVSLPCMAVVVWGVAAFVVLPDIFGNTDIPVFVVLGVIMVSAAVAVVSANADVAGRLADRLDGSSTGLAARLGLAYPLAKRFRTSLLLGMYALVIFTLTFLTTLSNTFALQAPQYAAETGAGYEVLVDSQPANPLTVEQLEARDDVAAATPLLRAFATFEADIVDDPVQWPLVGVGEGILDRGAPVLQRRAPEYGSDEDAWEAVVASDDLAMVSDFFLADGGGPPSAVLGVGDTFTVVNRATGDERELTVAGLVTSDFVFNGAYAGAELVGDLFGPLAAPVRHYVAVDGGADPDAVATRITADLLANGANARSFEAVVEGQIGQQVGFFRLFEGFLTLGLVIGIAGLGVVMVRAVRERQRQIGMLRAMGVPSGVVRTAFLVEAGFIAALGAVIGVGLGMVLSWILLTNSSAFGDSELAYQVPWGSVAILLGGPLVVSLVAVALPANRAAAIQPAVALRTAE